MPFLSRIVRYASPSSTFVLLTRLLCTALFDPSLYVQKVRIAAGAYGTIWNCNLMFPPMPQPDKPDRPALEPASASLVPPAVTDADIALASQFAKDTVAIKLLPLSKTIMDHCVLFDIFNEVPPVRLRCVSCTSVVCQSANGRGDNRRTRTATPEERTQCQQKHARSDNRSTRVVTTEARS